MKNIKEFDDNKIEEGIKLVLTGLGLDLKDENLRETPKRVMKSYHEILGGLINTDIRATEILNKAFPSNYHGMVTIGPIKVYSMCPHHFLPIQYSIYVAYIIKDKNVGLSKLPRLVELLAQRPVMQEVLTQDIVDYIEKILHPRGSAVVVKGIHGCMSCRGVKKSDAITTTSAMNGFFRENIATKEEFLTFVKINGTGLK